jgi:hypothetical protein
LKKKIKTESDSIFSHTKYLYNQDILIGAIGFIFNKANVPKINPIKNEYLDIIVDSIKDNLLNGIELEFETKSEFLKYEKT